MTIIAVCVPLYGSVNPQAFANYINFMEELSAQFKTKLFLFSSTFSAFAKNSLINLAIKSNADYALFYNLNILPTAEVISKLIQHNKDFIAPLFFTRDAFPNFKIQKEGQLFNVMNYPKNTLVKVDAINFDFFLAKLSALKKLAAVHSNKPLFDYDYSLGKADEDLYFSSLLIKEGFDIYVDTSALLPAVNGIIDRNYYLAKFALTLKNLKEKKN